MSCAGGSLRGRFVVQRVFCHDTLSSDRENTIFCFSFIPLATAGICFIASGVGQQLAICW